MSKYTTEVRFICENFAGFSYSQGYMATNDVIAKARENVFDFSYPIFDESYRSVLETKILKHFYTREIGAESVGLWKLWLDTRLNEIMPYYNQLYKSELIEFNPMYDVDLTTDHTRKVNGEESRSGEFSEKSELDREVTGSGTGSSESNGGTKQIGGNKVDRWEYFSDTPQGGIQGVANLTYLTNARHITDDGGQTIIDNTSNGLTENQYNDSTDTEETGKRSGENSGKMKMNNLEEYLQHVKGKNGGASYSERLKEFRQTFLNIDMQVIGDLNDLFMNLW